MKLRFFLTGVIFVFSGLVSRGQVTEMMYQGFETGETLRVTANPSTNMTFSTALHSSGNRSLELSQGTQDVSMILDTLDFSNDLTIRYITLEFDHICKVPLNSSSDYLMAKLYVKRANQSDANWTLMGVAYYNRTEGGSSAFSSLSAFNRSSYSEWESNGTTNDMWKSERFDINNVLTSGLSPSERKVMIKFEIRHYTGSGTPSGKWYFDNIKVKASSEMMMKPTLKMACYPDGYLHPNSRGAYVALDATTPLSVGINPDSVYLLYRVGSSPAQTKLPLAQVPGVVGRYAANIPFYGYDTLMSFYCVVKDATGNANEVRFPRQEGSWVEYRCIRGVEQPGMLTPQFTGIGATTAYPFPPLADNRSEWVYDSALLASAGYGPGTITALRFTTGAHTNVATRPRFQIRMKNAPTNYAVDTSIYANYPFTLSYMHVVYDSALTIPEMNANATFTIPFQDSFYYAGKDIVMQVVYDADVDMPATSIKTIGLGAGNNNKKTIWYNGGGANMQYDINSITLGNTVDNYRPAFVMTEVKNLPLLYDLGVSELVSPSFDTPMTQGVGTVTVRLKNFGALPVNGVRISYLVDGTISGHHDWTGNLAGGATQDVQIANNLNILAGSHTLCVWVEDTLTVGTDRVRDHEPYNDTSCSQFIVCDGPMHGIRRIGGAGAHFNTIEDFLLALSRCGIDDSLIVKLAPGQYAPFTLPYVSGSSSSHYVVFEPQSGRVTMYSDTTMTQSEIVNLEMASNVRFRNIYFVRRSASQESVLLESMVKMGLNSVNCRFEGCTFVDSVANPVAALRIGSLVNSGFSNAITVDGCTFRGGKIGVDLKGMASDVRSQNNTVVNSVFYNQYESAISVQNQTNVVIEKNEMYDVLSNTSYVLLVSECYGTSRVMSNKIYTSHGAGAMGVSMTVGTSANRFLIANNMIVSDDDGTANLMRSPLNIIQANYTDVVYNSVKMTATSRTNIAAATFGGGTLMNSRFLNNIVVCLDNLNYALNYVPALETSNVVGHNVYFSQGATMNRKSGNRYFDMAEWVVAEPADSLSVKVNPNFLNGSLVDLRTFSRQVKGVGIPLASVPMDMFDTLRGDSVTCPGAYEFVSLGYDFEPEALVNPLPQTCYMPAQTELVLRIRNNGTSIYSGSGLTVAYRVNNGTVHTVQVTQTIPADDSVTVHTGAMLSLPPNGIRDSVYNLKVWTSYATDPNQTNDTSVFSVTSRYHPAAPADVNMSVPYATTATITPTVGVDNWSVYVHTAGPQRPSKISWYHDTLDAEPFYVGPTLVTDTLREDTTFFFRQRRSQPIVRITQLEIKRGGTGNNATVGETPNAPYWLNANRKIALQLTNIGDERACLYGDSIVMVSTTAGLNNKVYRFNDSIFIEPGQSLVVQYVSGNSLSPTNTIHTGSTYTVSYNTNVAFLYRRGGVMEDAVVLNSVPNHGAPSYIWTGTGVNMTNSNLAAGIVRVAFVGNVNDWRIATNENPMRLNWTDEHWVRYTDNGCEGLFAEANVTLIAPPAADVSVEAPMLPSSSCGLGVENVSVKVRNYGIQPVSGLVLNYNAGGVTVTDTVPNTLAANSMMNYTFSTPLNLAFATDSLVTVTVWADAVTGDPVHSNDTSRATVLSLYTPPAPAPIADRTIPYATRDTITDTPGAGLIPVWYDYNGNVVDTGYTHVSDILYANGTMGVSHMAFSAHQAQIGTGTSTNGNSSFPSPYQPGNKYAKQQYIYSASELHAMGVEAGYIDSIAFDLQQILGNRTSVEFDDYYVSIGMTSDTIFSSTSAWKNTSVVYHRSPMTIYATDCNQWVPLRFDTPFYWDGESSVVVQIVHYIATKITTGVKSTYTAKTNTTLHKNGDSDLSPSTMNFVGAGTRGNNRPNIRFFTCVFGCESPVTNYNVQLVNIPSVDVALLWPDGIDTIDYNSCDSVEVYVNLRNQGASDINSMKVYYTLDNLATDSVNVTTTITPGSMAQALLLKRRMAPGRHTVTVTAAAPGDIITSNDTESRSFVVRFCGGAYTIAPTGADYHSFGEAIDTLNVVGVEGPVVFNVSGAIYNEQVVLNTIPGSSSTNTISFIGSDDSVQLIASTSQNNNYVFFLDSASNVTLRNIKIISRPTANGVNYANALVMQKGSNILIDNCTIRVKGPINNANASAVVLGDDISNLIFTNNVVDSGFYSIKTTSNTSSYNNIVVRQNTFSNFWRMGVNLRGVTNVTIGSNRIVSGVTIASRSLRGIYLAQVAGDFLVEKNHIYLNDNKTGGKMGIVLENINCIGSNPGFVSNNMIGCTSTGVADLTGFKPCGIWIDSMSSNINVLYNTVRIECGNVSATALYNEATCSFYTGATVSNIHVMNNIFTNFAKGYAYYVSELNTVTISNFNAYYTESERPFFWKQIRATLPELQNANTDDANSVLDRAYFVSNDDLHLVMTNFVSLAQYTTDVVDDIDGVIRSQIPAPTIGAHEMEICTHDMTVVEVTKPYIPADTNFNFPNKMPPNIEGDSICVVANFYNNGRSLETNVQWYAYMEGYESTTRTANRNLGTFNPSQMKTDSVMIPTSLGVINRHNIRVVILLNNDCSPDDNERVAPVYLAPAYNFEAVSATTATPPAEGCERQNSVLQLTVRNKGFKDIPAGTPLKIGFRPQITQPANTSISTMPSIVEDTVPLPTTLLCNQTVVLTSSKLANLYPTGLSTNIQIRLWGWCHHDLDVSTNNDSTSSGTLIHSYFTPAPPVGYDTTLAYGTWGAVRASQENSRPIRWYRDSNDAPFFTGNNYNLSRIWNNTPQYFHDSTYYLNCLSDKGCASNFSEVTVHVANRIPNDIAIKQVLAPLGSRVYMENDTVRVKISNFGTSSQTNIPITYRLKRGNTVVQTVTETCTVTIPAGEDYDFTFDSLLYISTPTQQQNYSLSIWTDLATDGTRRNDTLRTTYTFQSLSEGTYDPVGSSNPSFDITRISFNEIDFDMPPLGRSLTNLASYNAPDYPVMHITRGTSDSLFVEITPLDATQQIGRYKLWVFIDFDRSGTFSDNEAVVNDYTFYSNDVASSFVTIPNNASYGYMRMRVVVGNYHDFNTAGYYPTFGVPNDKDGHTVDFLLFVDAQTPVAHDIAITQIASPRSYLIRDDSPKTVSFRIANKGSEPVSQPRFHYSFENLAGADSSASGFVTYNGTLAPGTSALVSIPPHVFNFGVTTLRITYSDPEDTIHYNNSFEYEYNRFHIITLILDDDFDSGNKWYAPTGYNAYTHNYWELGTPSKTVINAAYSEPNAWVTDLRFNVATGTRGNVSYLYSPIINLAQIRADTISFFLRRNLINGSSLHVEFFNCDNKWVKLDWDSATAWYNNTDDHCFDGTTPGSAYTRFWIPCIQSRISGDFPELLQFRLVYTTPMGTSANSAYGEGCAIDNFRIGRAPIRTDAGVVAITHPTAPRYGETIYPKVIVHNYGTDTLREAVVGYTHYGTYMPKYTTAPCLIAPGAEDTITLTSSFLITSEFPDTFFINAFTKITGDIYRDNDSISQAFPLAPLTDDISAHSFIYPLNNVIAGDTNIQVTIRIRNFGENPIYTATASYLINNADRVDETIDFVELQGEPLQSMEYFNYTFRQRIRANMGVMRLTAIIKSDANEYIYNDTISKRVEGISAINDIAAAAMIIDTSSFGERRVQIVIENRGARGANGFEVGFYIDNNTDTIYREFYGRSQPLPALSTGYHMFEVTLPRRPAPYNYITGFVHMDGDIDASNDTTSVITSYFLDIEMLKLVVEETAQPDCRVFAVLRNNGNLSLVSDAPLQLRANINGGSTIRMSAPRRIEPGQTVMMEFVDNRGEGIRIPKSLTRTYTGTGRLTLGSDGDTTNNMTNIVEVVNHVEGVPIVESTLLTLEQNYPNPFTNRTTVPFSLPEAANVRFFVIDAMGHIINSFERHYDAGEQTITIDMEAYSSGIYYYGIEVNGERRMRKMIMK
jgi:hypothetical protein